MEIDSELMYLNRLGFQQFLLKILLKEWLIVIDIHSLSQQTQTQTPTLLTQSVKEKYFLYLSLT